jgi:hypothetical protein
LKKKETETFVISENQRVATKLGKDEEDDEEEEGDEANYTAGGNGERK